MRFYHVSKGHTEVPKQFLPRVPKSVGLTEDVIYPRICVADSIDRALSALCDMPCTTYDLKPYTIYSIDLPVESVIRPDYLYWNRLVGDALYTHEHWILYPVIMQGEHVYIRNFESDNYRIPDEDKYEEFWNLLEQRVPEEELAPFRKCSMDDMLRRVIPSQWEDWRIDEEDLADEIGLEGMRVMYNAEIVRG